MRHWRRVRAALACSIGLIVALTVSPALADKRLALVIGNSAYKNAPTLKNPSNDASDMAAALERLGFEVIRGVDLDYQGMRTSVRRFSEKLPSSDVALLFYAGHGLQVAGFRLIGERLADPVPTVRVGRLRLRQRRSSDVGR